MDVLFFKIFGIYVGFSVLCFYLRQNLISKPLMTKIVSAYLVLQVLQFYFIENIFCQWLLVFAPIFLFMSMQFFYLKHLESRFQSEFPVMITNIILQLKTGKSFRQALHNMIMHVDVKYTSCFRFIHENVAFSPQNFDKKMTGGTPFLRKIVFEFIKIDQTSHQSIEKLENFRSRLIIINEFRRRSGQIRGQVHLQAYVLVGIYALCFAFVAKTFSIGEFTGLILCSLFLFLVGLAFIVHMGKKIKWKI